MIIDLLKNYFPVFIYILSSVIISSSIVLPFPLHSKILLIALGFAGGAIVSQKYPDIINEKLNVFKFNKSKIKNFIIILGVLALFWQTFLYSISHFNELGQKISALFY